MKPKMFSSFLVNSLTCSHVYMHEANAKTAYMRAFLHDFILTCMLAYLHNWIPYGML